MIQIMVNGRPLDPKDAAKTLLPADTLLICPSCESPHVRANEPRTVGRIDLEPQSLIPRQQDRRCERCGHRWTATLAPAFHSFTR